MTRMTTSPRPNYVAATDPDSRVSKAGRAFLKRTCGLDLRFGHPVVRDGVRGTVEGFCAGYVLFLREGARPHEMVPVDPRWRMEVRGGGVVMALVPCEVRPVWHTPEACDSPFVCESEDRPGTVQTIPARVRDAVEVAGRDGSPEMRRVAVWMVEATVGGTS